MKKLLTHIAFILALIPAFFSFACTPSTPRVIVESDTYVVINVVDSVEENTTLADYMISLNNDIFAIENGMVVSINGIENAPDWSSCWMLYTTDEENSNPAWSVEYNGKIYGSANWGAESLVVKTGESYIWYYQNL